jgi:hypothetical protein
MLICDCDWMPPVVWLLLLAEPENPFMSCWFLSFSRCF